MNRHEYVMKIIWWVGIYSCIFIGFSWFISLILIDKYQDKIVYLGITYAILNWTIMLLMVHIPNWRREKNET